VERLFAGEEPLAKDRLGTLHDDATAMFGGVLEKEVFDKAGMVDLVDMTAEGFEVDQVAETVEQPPSYW